MATDRILAIIGMHRSGTSLVAGMLRALGWDVGPDEELMPPKPDNPRGFVEHLPAVRLNDRLLYRMGGSWDQPPALVPGWADDPSLDDLREEAAEIAARLTGRGGRVLLKDPRLSLTLPFWQTVTQVDHAVLVLRPPRPVVRSLLRREDGLDAGTASALFTRYLLTALRQDVRLHLVAPSALLDDPDGQLTALATALGHPPAADELADARAHVESDLWGRSSRSDQDDEPAGDAVEAAQRLHDLVAGQDGEAWRDVLGRLTAVEELAAAARQHRDRLAGLRAEARELRERWEGVREERDRARDAHARVREQRDTATRRARNLEQRLAAATGTGEGPDAPER